MRHLSFLKSNGRITWVLATAILIAAGAVAAALRASPDQRDVLRVAQSISGGGYSLLGTGSPQPIRFRGAEILAPMKNGVHCSGFTFWVCMKVASERGLLRNKDARAVKTFQQEWFGATKDSRERQAAFAAERLGIGRQIDPSEAMPGDFVNFWHPGNRSGHAVVFLEFLRKEGVIVGLRYRSAQPATDGVGEHREYFTSSGYKRATIDPKRFYVCRLNQR